MARREEEGRLRDGRPGRVGRLRRVGQDEGESDLRCAKGPENK